ncbi:MAG TPA: trehalose-phosphatase, partial [Polyangia bacterium]|nr:trehalose-phosphatase [Polyangia bacterium]
MRLDKRITTIIAAGLVLALGLPARAGGKRTDAAKESDRIRRAALRAAGAGARVRRATPVIRPAVPSEHWSSLIAELAKKPELHVIFDVDDTLVKSFKHGITTAEIPEAVLEDLRVLAARPNTSVTILSGKPLKKLEAMFPGMDNVGLMGNFGTENRVGGKYEYDPASQRARPTVQAVATDLVTLAEQLGIRASLVRNKDTSLSMHQEEVPLETWEQFRKGVLSRVGREKSLLAKTTDEVIEVVPADAADKGTALRRRLAAAHGRSWRTRAAVLFVGDAGGPHGG